jgi:hypothetical protein
MQKAQAILGLMSKHWEKFPDIQEQDAWRDHAIRLERAIEAGASREDMDEQMSRAQLELGISESMAFRKIVDEALTLQK